MRHPSVPRVLLAMLLALALPVLPAAAEDETTTGSPTILVGGQALDATAALAREAAIRAELETINATPAADPEARKRITEARTALAAALQGAAEVMQQIAAAPTAASDLAAELVSARAELASAQELAAREIVVDGVVDDERIRTLEAQSTRAAQDVANATETLQKLEGALAKRQTDFDGLEALQTERKARGDSLRAELEQAPEDAIEAREILALQLETNQVRRGAGDLRVAHHTRLRDLDALRRDVGAARVEVARVQQTLADATLARFRAARQAQLEAEAVRREAEAQRMLRDAELAETAAVKAIKSLEALVGRLEMERAQDGKRILELKALRDEGLGIARIAATRVKSIQLLYPEGATLEPWQREGLAEQVRQHERDAEEFERFRLAQMPDLNALLAQVLTKGGRFEIFGERLNAAQDRIEVGDDDEARAAAIERELGHSRDEDYRLWLNARLDFLRGQTELRPDEVARFRADWDRNTTQLKSLVKARTEELVEIRTIAEVLRAALLDASAALAIRRAHLERITFWLREPSLFSGENLSAAREEATALASGVAALPRDLGGSVSDGAEGEGRGRLRVVALAVFLLVVFVVGLVLRIRRRGAIRALPPAALGRWARVKHASAVLLAAAWLPAAVLAATLFARQAVFAGHALGTALVAVVAVWTLWALARGVNRALFRCDADGRCLVGCTPRTARGARHIVRTLLIGSGVFFGLTLLLRTLGAPRLAGLVGFAWGGLAVFVGAWLAVRRDVLTVFFPAGRGGLMVRTARGLLQVVWPLLVLVGAGILALNAAGYRTASGFFATRVLWFALAFLGLGAIHALARAFLQRRLPADVDAADDDVADAPVRLQLVSRLLGGLLTAVLVVGAVLALGWVFDLNEADWERLGAISLTQGEAGAGLTLGRLARAAIIFWVSIGLARFVRDAIRAALRARQMPRGSRYVVRTLVFYTLVTLGTLAALSALGLEMAQFGWFLTAAGVGIGFGLQEIISNFISGLILFFERPVQVGDVVSVGQVQGDVQQINIRSTVVRTRDGVAIIIPNKKLITEDVVNWSHGEQRTRLPVPVSVAYGSDVPLVNSILLRIAAEEARVLNRPKPEVSFLAYGESELRFELLLWLATPDPTARRRVLSAVNTRIDGLFREHGVEIPFPQRDLHLRSSDVGTLGPAQVLAPPPDDDA